MRAEPDDTRERDYDGELMAVGKRAEDVVKDWLRKQKSVDWVEDVRKKPWAMAGDVDCIIHRNDGSSQFAEIKLDSNIGRTPNYLFELARWDTDAPTVMAHRVAWSVSSVADLLMFYASSINEIHLIKMAEYRDAMHGAFIDRGHKVQARLHPTDKNRVTINLLIPKEYVERQPSFKRYGVNNAKPCPF